MKVNGFVLFVSVTPYIINLSNNGPVVLGATITFESELLNDDGSSPSGTFKFFWQDNAIPQNTGEVSSNKVILPKILYYF